MIKLEFERTYDINNKLVDETVYIRATVLDDKGKKTWCGLGLTINEFKELRLSIKDFTLNNITPTLKSQDEFGKIIIYK